jgi:adenylate cyclase
LNKVKCLYRGIQSQSGWVQATILFTDITGFSAIIAYLPPKRQQQVFESLTGEYYPLLHKCVHDYGGSVDEFIGDGMMAVFRTPEDAINAAWQIRERVAIFNTQQKRNGYCPFPTRMAIDSGLVLFIRQSWRRGIVAPGTYLGEAVNRAAHLAQVGSPGRVLVSQNTLDQLTNKSNFVAWSERQGQGLAAYELWL